MSSNIASEKESRSEQSWRELRERVLKRDGNECQFCGKTNEKHLEETDRGLDAHHIIPKSDGGEDTLQNLVALCRSCHRTMESLHGRAMKEIVDDEDAREELEKVKGTKTATYDGASDIEDQLRRFLDEHPIFEKEIGASRKPGIPSVDRLEAGASPRGYVDIETEWQFASAWGYKQGLLDALNRLDTEVDFALLNDE